MELDAAYLSYRPLLMSIAYRMLGSVSDAEDLVQDVFLILGKQEQDWDRGSGFVLNLKAYLCKIVTNRCLDYLKSARKQREVYVGPWLPEPNIQSYEQGASQDPLQTVVLEDTISYAFLILLDRLTPVERAVFILREAFDYDYRDIAEMIGRTELGCRKIYSRLKHKIQAEPPVSPPDESQSLELVQRFIHAASSGNMQALIAMLNEDITVYTDGGGKVHAATRPIRTAAHAAAFLLGLAAKLDNQTQLRIVRINGSAGLIIDSIDDRNNAVINIEVSDNQIRNIYIMRNPDKLRHLSI